MTNLGRSELAIVYQSIGTLLPNPRNARTHPKHQIRQIAASIKVFGFTNPTLIDRHKRIIAGHGRVEAAKLLGIEQIPTILLENLTEDQIRAYILADNQIAAKAGWDKEILAIELQHLITIDDAELDVTITGFEIPEIDLLLQNSNQDEGSQEDVIDAAGAGPSVSRLGDLWLLGKHRVFCGDALDGNSFRILMETARARAVFTDPPYNVPIDGHASGNGGVRHREFAMATGEMTSGQFTYFLTTALHPLARYSLPGSIHFICMDWRHQLELLTAGQQVYSELKNLCVWVKSNAGMGSFYRSQHELIFVFKHGKAPHRNNVQLGQFGRDRTNVWNYPSVINFGQKGEEGNLLALHPTVKPVAMVADAILDCSNRGDIVLDSFLGSGSTLLAAERTGRVCYGMELDPLYVDAAIRRWHRHTGDSAIHAVTGERFDDVVAHHAEAHHA